ncbi:MAG: tetratricopeptide repeat protein [Desulfobulbaceae bacterium]|nr:tetratricopeptide repeat protein [Desulfobulbaceae bacterium]
MVQSGDFETALRKYEIVSKRREKSNQAQWEYSSLLLVLGRFDQAAVRLEKLIEAFPNQVRYLNGLAFVTIQQGYLDRAVELLDRAIAVDPENHVTLVGLSQTLLSLGKPAEALPYIEKTYLLNAQDLALKEQLATVYAQLGMYGKARPLVVQLAEQPDAPLAYLKLGAQVHDGLELKNLAAEYWQKVLEKDDSDETAHVWLASYYRNEGRCSDALPHLLFALKQTDADPKLHAGIGECYVKLNDPSKAMAHFEKFLAYFPGDKEVIRQLVNIHASLGQGEATLAALDRYFEVEPDPSPVNLRQAAQLYDAAGRYHDAIPLYRRLLKTNPNDPEVLATLAQDLLSIGEDEGALRIWEHLARISPNRKEIYLDMLELLGKLDRQDERIALLDKLHRLDPEDLTITLKLVASLLDKGNREKAETVFQEVSGKEIFSIEILKLRADNFEKMEMYAHALKDYEEIIRSGEESRSLHLKCIHLCGLLGKIELLGRHYEFLQSVGLSQEERLLAANAFRDGGDFETALGLYDNLAVYPSLSGDFRQKLFLELATLYQRQGLFFEAEQALRQALLGNLDRAGIIARLVALQLEAGAPEAAGLWLTQLQYADNSSSSQCSSDYQRRIVREWLEMRRYNTISKYRAAARTGQKLRAELESGQPFECQGQQLHDLVLFELAKSYLEERKTDEAAKICQLMLSHTSFNPSALALLEKIYIVSGNQPQAETASRQSIATAGKDLWRMLELTEAYANVGLLKQMEHSALLALGMEPDSLAVSLWYVKALRASGQLARARDMLQEMEGKFFSSAVVESQAAHVTFQMGLYQESLSYCEAVLKRQPDRADMELLKGRIYWRRNEWQDSLDVYKRYAADSVFELFVEKSHQAGLALPLEEKGSFWQRFRFSIPDNQELVERVMAPSFAGAEGNTAVNEIAVPLYSHYMWQQRFAAEMYARRAVNDGDYFQAANQFAELIRKHPEDMSLIYDLAGVYSRLDKLGEEAMLYEQLAQKDKEYPGLAEAMERNRLKLQPRMDLTYRLKKEEGRNGYKAMKQSAADFGSWVSFKPGQEGDASLSRIKYSSTDTKDSLLSSRAVARYEATNLFNRLDVRLGGGVESFDDGNNDTGIIECAINGKMGDRIQGEFSYARDVVADTLASLTRSIVSENVHAGFYLGILPRLLTGADYEFTYYSDGNDIEGYSVWASYILLPEPTSLEFKFHYEFKDTSVKASRSGSLLADGFLEGDSPYWTPRDYWKNSYGLLWKHKLSADTLERGTPSYYSAAFMLDYDSDGHIMQTVKGAFVIELTTNFMLESSVGIVSSDEYRSSDFTLSAIYRW